MNYQIPVFKNGVLTLISAEELAYALQLKSIPTPSEPPVDTPAPDPVVVKLFGEPRTHVGTHAQGYPVFAHSADTDLLILLDEVPDTFARRGTNLDYVPLPGIVRPSGKESAWSGNAEPDGCGRPDAHYRIRYFNGKADEPYYERSTQPDEVPVADVAAEVPVLNTVTPKPGPSLPDATDQIGGIFTA